MKINALLLRNSVSVDVLVLLSIYCLKLNGFYLSEWQIIEDSFEWMEWNINTPASDFIKLSCNLKTADILSVWKQPCMVY